jgi:hypothetical protein
MKLSYYAKYRTAKSFLFTSPIVEVLKLRYNTLRICNSKSM